MEKPASLSDETWAAIQWLGMPDGTPFPLAKVAPSPHPESLADVENLRAEFAGWDARFLAWTRACCCFRDRCWQGTSSLFISYSEWITRTGHPGGCDFETFQVVLKMLGFEVADGLAYGLLLKADLQAARWGPEETQQKTVPIQRKGERYGARTSGSNRQRGHSANPHGATAA